MIVLKNYSKRPAHSIEFDKNLEMKVKTHRFHVNKITLSLLEKCCVHIGLKRANDSLWASECPVDIEYPSVVAKRSSLPKLNLIFTVLKLKIFVINILQSFIYHIWMNVFTNSKISFFSPWR